MFVGLLTKFSNYCSRTSSVMPSLCWRIVPAKNRVSCFRVPFTGTEPCRLLSSQIPAAPARVYDVNTRISKDIMLFKYDNPRFFKMLNIFALSQFLFWAYLCHFSYTTLRDAPVKKETEVDLPWYQKINLGENKFRNSIAIMCFCIGYGILFASWMFTLRSVRFLVLRKGGDMVSVVTYAPFGTNRIMDVPLKYVSAQESREAARVTVPIKIKNRAFFYVLDMRGEFMNTKIYDYTVGMARKLK